MENDTSFALLTKGGLTFFDGEAVTPQNLPDTIVFDALYITILGINICKLL
jgi:hypothetical protein